MNIYTQVFVLIPIFSSFEFIRRSGITVVLCLTFENPSPVSLGSCTILHFDQWCKRGSSFYISSSTLIFLFLGLV